MESRAFDPAYRGPEYPAVFAALLSEAGMPDAYIPELLGAPYGYLWEVAMTLPLGNVAPQRYVTDPPDRNAWATLIERLSIQAFWMTYDLVLV